MKCLLYMHVIFIVDICFHYAYMSLETGSLEACAVVRLALSVQGTTGSPQLHPSATLPAFPASTTHSRDIQPFEEEPTHHNFET